MKISEMTNEELAECIESAQLAPAKYVRKDDLNFHSEAIHEAAARLRNLGEIGEAVGREATREKSSQVGNAAKIHEALDKLLNFLRWEYAQDYPVSRDKLADAIDTGVSALSAPPRNCDVGMAEEQERRWHANCGIGIPNCKHCNVYEQARKSGLVDDKNMIRFDCRFIWAQMPYKEGGSK